MIDPLVVCVASFAGGSGPRIRERLLSSLADNEQLMILGQRAASANASQEITFAAQPEVIFHSVFAVLARSDEDHGRRPTPAHSEEAPLSVRFSFAPLVGLSAEECSRLTAGLAQRLAAQLPIPVSVALAAGRGAASGGLTNDLSRTTAEAPASGVLLIASRLPQFTCCIRLGSNNLSDAENLAAAARRLPGVFAGAQLADGRALVELTICDPAQTSLPQIIDDLQRTSAHPGAPIAEIELLGLIPLPVVVEATHWKLKISPINLDQVLELRLKTLLEQRPSFLDRLAAGNATPAGGSAAAHAAAMAAALVTMVARLSSGRPQYAAIETRMQRIEQRAAELRSSLELAVEQDAQAFAALLKTRRLPPRDDLENALRAGAIAEAAKAATLVPLQVARQGVELLELAAEAAEIGNLKAIADAGAAGLLAGAAYDISAANVRFNLLGQADQNRLLDWQSELEALAIRRRQAQTRLEQAEHKRGC